MKKGQKRLRFCSLGGGKMGEALIQGLLAGKVYRPAEIRVVDPDPGRRDRFEKEYDIRSAVEPVDAEICLLAMKPQDMADALARLEDVLAPDSLVLSIAAGISTEWIQARLSADRQIVRAMPNAAALVQKSATGIYFPAGIPAQQRTSVLRIFDAVGTTVVVEKEGLLDQITGLSGSGPGYVFLLLEAFTEAGVTVGLPRNTARDLALQTFAGSVAMAQATGKPFPILKEMITSPGGTTAAGLKVLEEHALRAAVLNAVEAASRRAGELAR